MKQLIDLRDAIPKLLDFAVIVGAEFLDLPLVPGFRLLQELAVKLLDLRNPFWNEGIYPGDSSGKQVGLGRLPGLLSLGRPSFVTCPSRGLGDQSAIKFDYFRSDAGIDQVLKREMSVTSSLFYQRGCAGYLPIG